MIFGSKRQEEARLWLQRIKLKSSEVGWLPHLVESSINIPQQFVLEHLSFDICLSDFL